MPLESAFQDLIERHRMLTGVRRVLVAVSGGADSTALLHLLARRASDGLELHVAHLDHGWRGEAGEDDLRHVRAAAEALGLPVTAERLAPEDAGPAAGGGREARARAARLRFLERVAGRVGAERIATGHTRDDQAETLLLRLLRGAGGRGLAGIPPVRLPYIRPLLAASRAEVERWLRLHGIPWREDASNRDPTLARNRLRLEILPALDRAFGPGVRERLAATADLLRDDETYLEGAARRWLDGAASPGAVPVRLPVGDLAAQPAPLRRRILRLATAAAQGESFPPDRATVARLERLAAGSLRGPLTLRAGAEASVERDDLVWRAAPVPGGPAFSALCRVPGRASWPEAGISLSLQEIDRSSLGEDIRRAGAGVAYLDLDLTGRTLALRGRRAGDAFRPLGLGGWKKLQDFLVDARVPRAARDRVGVLTAGREVVWVVGHRIDDRFKVTPSTRRVLVVSREGA